MSDPLIWTRDDILRFTHAPNDLDREWAWSWLQRHHPEEASRQATRALADPFHSIVRDGIEIFASSPTAEAHDAIEELRRRTDLAPSVRKALDLLGQPAPKRTYDDPINDEVARFSPLHDEVRRETPKMLRSGELDTVLVALGALGNQQYQWATDILLDALPELVTSRDPIIVWDTFEQLCDPRSLPALAAVWAPGERYVANLYVHLHRRSGSTGPVPTGIARDAEEERARSKARLERKPEDVSVDGRRLQLRCAACGRTGDYDFAAEAIATVLGFSGAHAHKKRKPTPAQPIVTCKHCGVADAYDITSFSMISAVGAVQALKAARAKGSPSR